MKTSLDALAHIIVQQAETIKTGWKSVLSTSGATGGGRIKDAELQKQCSDFLSDFGAALAAGASNASESAFAAARAVLDDVSRSRAAQGFSPTETATFVFVRRQNIWRILRPSLAECGLRLGVDVMRRAYGVASADARWSVA